MLHLFRAQPKPRGTGISVLFLSEVPEVFPVHFISAAQIHFRFTLNGEAIL